MERVAIIGYGAIGRLLLRRLAEPGRPAQIAAVVASRRSAAAARSELSIPVFTSMAEALETRPTLVVECGGHAALREHGTAALEAKLDLLVASVGALCDPALERTLREAAGASGAQLLLPSGAVGGLDALAAARYAGLDEVAYRSIKPVRAWRGTHAETLLELDRVAAPTEFFAGNARDAARLFPQNANVAAAIALAGCGFEATRVTLTADPHASGNMHRIAARGAFGSMEVAIEARALPENPKTSMLAGLSLLRAIESRSAALRFA